MLPSFEPDQFVVREIRDIHGDQSIDCGARIELGWTTVQRTWVCRALGTDKAAMCDAVMSEVLFEFRYVGSMVRVAAVDPETNTEVIVVGATKTNSEMLKNIAARKLRLALSRSSKPSRQN